MFPPKAKILGTDISGLVESVGKQVTQFQVGDVVFGMSEGFGAFAESRWVEFLLADSRCDDPIHIAELFTVGHISPVVNRSYPLREAGEALRRVGENQGIGKVVIVP